MNQQFVDQKGVIVDFKDFLWKLFEQWKAVIVFVLIIMLLFSATMHHFRVKAEENAIEEAKAIEAQSSEEMLPLTSQWSLR